MTLLELPDEILIKILKYLPNLKQVKLCNKRLNGLSEYLISLFKSKYSDENNYIHELIVCNRLFKLQFLYYNINYKIAEKAIIKSNLIGNDRICEWFVENAKINNICTICIYLTCADQIEKTSKIIEKCNKVHEAKDFIKWMVTRRKFDDFISIFKNVKNKEIINYILEVAIKHDKKEHFEHFIQFVNCYDEIKDIVLKYDSCRFLQWLIDNKKIEANIELYEKCEAMRKINCQCIMARNLKLNTAQIVDFYKMCHKKRLRY